MTIEEFAARHRVRVRRDSCNDEIIPGRPHKAARQEDRSHIYDHGDGGHFGVALMLNNPRKWTFAKQRLVPLGFVVKQDGEGEGTLLFDPTDEREAKAALKEAGVKRERVYSPEQIEAKRAIAANLNEARQRQQGPQAAPESQDRLEGREKHPKLP
jgi:hypothetical protein